MIKEPLILLIDIIFILLISTSIAWYFYFYQKREVLGGYLGAVIIATLGSLLFLFTLQLPIRDMLMWLMSPMIGSTTQLSRVNILAAVMGAFLSLFIVIRINYNRQRK